MTIIPNRTAQEHEHDRLETARAAFLPKPSEALEAREADARAALAEVEQERAKQHRLVGEWETLAARHVCIRRKLTNIDAAISTTAADLTAGLENLGSQLEGLCTVIDPVIATAFTLSAAPGAIDFMQKLRVKIIDEITASETKVRAFAKQHGVPREILESCFQ